MNAPELAPPRFSHRIARKTVRPTSSRRYGPFLLASYSPSTRSCQRIRPRSHSFSSCSDPSGLILRMLSLPFSGQMGSLPLGSRPEVNAEMKDVGGRGEVRRAVLGVGEVGRVANGLCERFEQRE